jgi:hypothetical protein
VLIGLDDVAARVGDERADRGDDAGPVGHCRRRTARTCNRSFRTV